MSGNKRKNTSSKPRAKKQAKLTDTRESSTEKDAPRVRNERARVEDANDEEGNDEEQTSVIEKPKEDAKAELSETIIII